MAETKEQVKHTETPWNIFRNEDGIDHIGTGTRKVVAFPWNKFENDDEVNVEDEANAEFIVRAVNCHEELLAQLISARGFIPKNQPVVRNNVNAAIAKAEGR